MVSEAKSGAISEFVVFIPKIYDSDKVPSLVFKIGSFTLATCFLVFDLVSWCGWHDDCNFSI